MEGWPYAPLVSSCLYSFLAREPDGTGVLDAVSMILRDKQRLEGDCIVIMFASTFMKSQTSVAAPATFAEHVGMGSKEAYGISLLPPGTRRYDNIQVHHFPL